MRWGGDSKGEERHTILDTTCRSIPTSSNALASICISVSSVIVIVIVSICISGRLCYCPQLCHLSEGSPKLDPHSKPQHCVSQRFGNSGDQTNPNISENLQTNPNISQRPESYYEMVDSGSTSYSHIWVPDTFWGTISFCIESIVIFV